MSLPSRRSTHGKLAVLRATLHIVQKAASYPFAVHHAETGCETIPAHSPASVAFHVLTVISGHNLAAAAQMKAGQVINT